MAMVHTDLRDEIIVLLEATGYFNNISIGGVSYLQLLIGAIAEGIVDHITTNANVTPTDSHPHTGIT